MRPADLTDLHAMSLMAHECDMPPLSPDMFERMLIFVGDHGYVLIDLQDERTGIVHVVVTPDGRGKWAKSFFDAFLRWAFTGTRIERLNAAIPSWAVNVMRFARESGFQETHATPQYRFMYIDIIRWMSVCEDCLAEGEGAVSGFKLADREMVKRVTGACHMMHEAGMEHKAWYIYELYAKLFGYKTEA